jgi:hypothetical protein
VRREAIAILREWPCTNGILHSLGAAKFAEWIASVEGKCCDALEFVPGDFQVKIQSLKVSLKNGAITVECVQYSINGVLEPRKANLHWP